MKKVLKIKKGMWVYLLYAVLLYIVAIVILPSIDSEELTMYHYELNIHGVKIVVSTFLSLSLLFITSNCYYWHQKLSDKIILLLSMLYFLPGFVISGVINFEWAYMLQYYLYYLAIVFFDRIIASPKKPFTIFNRKSTQILKYGLILLAMIYPLFLIGVFGKTLSLSNIILTLNDSYGVRSAAKELNVHWIIILIEKWGMYFGCVMVTFFLRKKKYILGTIFVVIGLFYFILQGNRIFFFFIVIAVVLGIIDLKRDNARYVFLAIGIAFVLEYYILSGNTLGMILNVFRRFSLVPNMISTSYFDFFQTAEHDWLRDIFTGIYGIFGQESPYGYDINYMIGQQYYGFKMYANNGLFGGAYHEFGVLGIIIDPAMLVLMLRLFEKVMMRADQNSKWILAVVLASLTINEHVIWALCFKISYIPMLFLSLLLFFNSDEYSNGDRTSSVLEKLVFESDMAG